MKKAMMQLVAALVWAAWAIGGRAETVSGHSGPFAVDTRARNFAIADVKSEYCHGVYGANGGRAVFLSGIPARIQFEVSPEGKDVDVTRVVANGHSYSGSTFAFDVGTLPVGGALEVVAYGWRGEEETESVPFRVNFDMAQIPDVQKEWFWEGALKRYRQLDFEPLSIFPACSEVVDLGNAAFAFLKANMRMTVSFDAVPTLSLQREVDATTGVFRQTTVAGQSIGSMGFGTMVDVKIKSETKGGFLEQWNPSLARWQSLGSVSLVGIHGEGGKTLYPIFGLYGSVALSGGMDVGTEWKNHEYSWMGEGDPLVGIKAAGGMGFRNVHAIGWYAKGGLHAKVSSSEEPAIDLDFETGAEYSDMRTGEFDKEIAYAHKRIPLYPANEEELSVSRENLDPDFWKLIDENMCRDSEGELVMVCTPDGSAHVGWGVEAESPSVAARGGAARNASDRGTLLTVAVESGGVTSLETPWDDGTPDSNPQLGADAEGQLFAAWMNAKTAYAGDATTDEILGMQEIAVAVRNPATGTWTAGSLTDNTVLDAAPVLAVGSNGVAFAAWLRNDANGWHGVTEEPSRLYASRFSGGTWSAPVLVASLTGALQSFDLATDGTRAVLVWAEALEGADGDFDFGLHASVWDAGAWGTQEALSPDGGTVDMSPKAFFGTNGLYSVVWNRGDDWMMGEEGAMSAAVAIPLGDEVFIPGEVSLVSAGMGKTAMLWSLGGEVRCMVFDQGTGNWTAPAVVAGSDKTIIAFGAAFDPIGNILLATEETEITVGEDGLCEYGGSEVVQSIFSHGADPAVLATDFAFGTNNVVAGELAPIVTTVRNLGLAPATNVTVRFWVCDGELEDDEDARCELNDESGEACVIDLPGGAAVVVTNLWMVEDFKTNLTFVAQVVLPDGVADLDTANNVAEWHPGIPSLSLEKGRCAAAGSSLRLLTATLVNRGLAAAEAGTTVSFRLGAPNGAEVGRDVAGVVRAGEGHGYDAGAAWEMAAMTWTSAWTMVYAVIDTGDAEEDAYTAVPIRVMTPLDRDGDGLLDGEEEAMGTNPLDCDTDWDGVGDYDEVYVELTDPKGGGEVPDIQRVTFDANGGTCGTGTRTYTGGTAYRALPTPQWTGHVWLGWFTEAEGGKRVTAESPVIGAPERTLYAHWTERQTVAFDANGGTCDTETKTVNIGEKYGAMPTAVWEGHLFMGWFNAAEGGKQVTANHTVSAVAARTLWAHWIDFQTVTLAAHGGTGSPSTMEFGFGGKYAGLPVPTKAGAAFLGWFTTAEGGKQVTANHNVTATAARTLHAHWTTVQNVAFALHGGSCATTTKAATIGAKYGKLPKPTWDGHVFLGWFDAAKGGNQVTAETIVPTMANRTLHAQWTTTQTVTFDANGGTCNTTTKKATIGAKYGTLPKATREGYMFLGWFTSPEGGKQVTTNHTVTATAARTFYAHWIDHQTVTFDAQGGTCDTVTMDFDIGGKYAGLPDAEWEGHVFAGWFTAAEGGKRVTTNHTVTTALSRIFWAQWNVSASSLAISGFAMKPAGTAGARGGRGPVPGVLSFEAEEGRVYELQWTPVLGGEWTTLRRWTAENGGTTRVELTITSSETTGFFRLVAPAD